MTLRNIHGENGTARLGGGGAIEKQPNMQNLTSTFPHSPFPSQRWFENR